MKKLGKLFLILFTISTVFTSCRDTKEADDVGDAVEDVADDIEDAVD
jgi:predicted small secreted protein